MPCPTVSALVAFVIALYLWSPTSPFGCVSIHFSNMKSPLIIHGSSHCCMSRAQACNLQEPGASFTPCKACHHISCTASRQVHCTAPRRMHCIFYTIDSWAAMSGADVCKLTGTGVDINCRSLATGLVPKIGAQLAQDIKANCQLLYQYACTQAV